MVAVMLAAWLFWLSLRAACLALFAQSDPGIVAQLRPVPTLALLRQARDLPADAPEARSLLARAARADPLAPEPYRAAARLAAAADDPVGAVRLLEAARTRAPRQAVVQLELLALYVPLGMAEAAIDAADRAMRVARGPGVMQDLAPALPAYAAATGARGTLAQALARHPDWARHRGPRGEGDALSSERLAALIVDEAEQDPVRREQAAHAAHLVVLLDRGDPRGAARAFDLYLSADGTQGGRGVREPYDREFQALPGPAPLNWRLRSADGGSAAIRFDDGRSDGYLRADLTGAPGGPLAEQAMLLPPGSYELRTRVRTLHAEGAPAIVRGAAWRVACRGRGAALAMMPLTAGAAWRERAVRFAVPAGCAAQTIALVPLGTGAGAVAIDFVRVVPGTPS